MHFNYRLFFYDREEKLVPRICNLPLVDVGLAYVTLFGIIGMGLCVLDIVSIVRAGTMPPCSLWRARIKSGTLVSASCERDLKLITLVLSAQYYFLLIIGTLTKNSLLFVPWLVFDSIVVAFECLMCVCRCFVDGLDVRKTSVMLSIFVVYNWLVVFCYYNKVVGYCL